MRKAKPPAGAIKEAKKALRWRDKYGRKVVKGATRVGWTRANQIASGRALTEATIRRMAAFQRHRKNAAVAERYQGEPWRDRGRVAWATWGGTAGVNWAIRKVSQFNREDKKKKAKRKQNGRARRRRKRSR